MCHVAACSSFIKVWQWLTQDDRQTIEGHQTNRLHLHLEHSGMQLVVIFLDNVLTPFEAATCRCEAQPL